ncbi:MAG: rhodanese-like domain-containing protein [Candidatus Aenigmatarchaeota archaeon]
MEEVAAKDLNKNLKSYQKKCVIIDVRSPEEYGEEHIGGAVNIPLEEIPDRLGELDKKKELILVCLSGLRSRKAIPLLEENGFKATIVKGGMIEWRRALGPAYFAQMAGEGGED